MTAPRRAPVRAVIFDLDGVLVSTDELHFRAWSEMAAREGIPFTRDDNHRLRGRSRMESLELILERAPRSYSSTEKDALAAAKNARYVELLAGITRDDAAPGALVLMIELHISGIRTAVASSSRNARDILHRIGLDREIDVVVDGNDIARAKPDPEVFLRAAAALGLAPHECAVVEDAPAGIEAAIAGGFRTIGVGEQARVPGITAHFDSLGAIDFGQLVGTT
ncbi:MAG: beta-phosphoglucomutase [Phycisphaerales bacterium]